MSQQVRLTPGTYVVHLRIDHDGEAQIQPADNRDAKAHAIGLPDDVFAFYYFDVGEDGLLKEDLDRANCSKQYFVDAELLEYDAAVNLPGITEHTLERMRTLNTPAMRYASGRRVRFFNPDWQEVVSRQ